MNDSRQENHLITLTTQINKDKPMSKLLWEEQYCSKKISKVTRCLHPSVP
jgi:hypothetical protein